FRGGFYRTDVGDARVVHENIEAFLARQSVENFFGARLIGNVADVSLGIASGDGNFLRRSIAGLFVEIENAHRRALLCEALRNGPADSAGGAGDDGDLAVQPERIAALRGVAQRETPRFQGMKSFCARISALVRRSPLATWMTRSKIR